jgi:hypothetical protein
VICEPTWVWLNCILKKPCEYADTTLIEGWKARANSYGHAYEREVDLNHLSVQKQVLVSLPTTLFKENSMISLSKVTSFQKWKKLDLLKILSYLNVRYLFNIF